MKLKLLHIIKLPLILFVLLILFDNSFTQWVNDPTANTKLVIDPSNPINISSSMDFNGGAYIVWQDKKNVNKNDIYFMHVNNNGEVSFRADGKTVSTRNGAKENPISILDPAGYFVVLWKGFDKNKPELFIQKLNKNGLRLWNDDGLQLTTTENEIIDYSLCVDKGSYTYASFISKNQTLSNKYSVRYQTLNPNGKFLRDSLKGSLYNSNYNISETKILSDNVGGSYVFWLENLNQKTVLRLQYVDSSGSKKWGAKPLSLSKSDKNVITYSVGKLGKNIFAAITYQGSNKIIYLQLISENGKLLWGADGKLLTYQKGSQINPQFAFVDSSVVVSWTSEHKKTKDVFIQRFDVKGNKLWGQNEKKVINITGNQFGQRIVYDQKNGIIIAWIDKRKDDLFANLFIQKLDLKGKFEWGDTGVKIASSKNTQKSYLNLVPDGMGGAIAIFKGISDNQNNIYGQKIFSTGTYASQILGFSAKILGDSVKISWYAANEIENTTYSIFRTANENSSENDWELLKTIDKNKNNVANYYEYFDVPDTIGSIYYRVIQRSDKTPQHNSPVEKVDYFKETDHIILAQNSPNPFSDKTKIKFYLPKEEGISFEIFNSNIETIKKIDDVEYPAGKNEIVFNAENLPSGIYFYRLKVGKFVDVKKMVIAQR